MGYAILSAFCFGTLAIFGKFIFRSGISPEAALAWRFWLAGIILFIVLIGAKRRSLPWRDLAKSYVLGALVFSPQSFLFFSSLNYLDAGVASVFLYLYPSFVILLVWLFEKKSPSKKQILCVGLAFLGCALVGGRVSGTISGIGVLLASGSALTYAGYLLIAARASKGIEPLVSVSGLLLGAAGTFTCVSLLLGTFQIPDGHVTWIALLGNVLIATVAAMLFLFAAFQKIGPARYSLIATIEPLVTLVIGILVLDEKVNSLQLFGAALVLMAVVFSHDHPLKSPRSNN